MISRDLAQHDLFAGTITDIDKCLEFATVGCFCEWDLFGIETSLYQVDDTTDMPSDAQRMQFIIRMIEEGYTSKLLIAHDVHTKHRLVSKILTKNNN